MNGSIRPALSLVPDEPDQVLRLNRFRAQHPGRRGLQVVGSVAVQWGSFRLPVAQAVWCDFGQPLRAPASDAWAWLHCVLSARPLVDCAPCSPAAQPELASVR